MSLILAIEPDQRQAAQLADLIRERLDADLVHARTTEGALTALAGIGDRVPDLVLVPSLLSAQEDAAIAGALRVIATAANVRMLTIPVLAGPAQPPQHQGVFAKLRGRKAKKAPGGCDPAVFADQIAAYLAEAAAERRAREAEADLMDPPAAIAPGGEVTAPQRDPVPPRAAPPVFEDLPAGTGEPVVETVTEPTPIRYAPIVLAPPPRPAGEAPPSIWLTPPTAPLIKPDVEISFREPLTETAAVHESVPAAIDESAEPLVAATTGTFEEVEARVLSQPRHDEPPPLIASDDTAQVVTTIAPPEANGLDDQLPMLAIEELLEAIALDEQASSPDIAIDEVPTQIEQPEAVIAFEPEVPFAAIDEGPVVVAIPESDDLSEFAPGPETVVAQTPVAPRRRRKNRRANKSESDDRFDVDALLAPLLSELAAKRASSDQRNESVVSPREEPAPATPTQDPEAISNPSISVLAPESVPAPNTVPGPQPFTALHDSAATTVDHRASDYTADAYVEPAGARIEDTPIEQPRIHQAPVPVVAVAAASDELRSDEAALDEEATDETAIGEASPIDATAVAVAVTSALPIDVVPVGAMSEEVLAIDVMPADAEPLDVPPQVAMSAAVVPVPSMPVEIAPVGSTPIEVAPLAAIPVAPTPTAPTPIAPTPVAPTPVAPTPVAAAPVAAAPVAPAPIFAGVAAEPEVDPMFFVDDVRDGTPDPAPHDRPAWVELIESLRKDIERLKAERTPPAAAPAPAPSAPPVAESQPPRIGRVLSIAAARPAGQAKVPHASKVRNEAPRVKGPKPVQDQWGLFDPDQCGFAALRAKLDEISTREEVPV